MARGRLFHGWKIVGAGLVVQAMQSTFLQQAYGTYSVVLKAEFGWSNTLFSVGYSLNRLESGLLGPLHGWALDRFGIRRVMRLGAVLMAIGFLLLSQLNSRLTFLAFFLVTAVGASLCGFLTVVTATVRWFERRRSRALSISQSGFAIGGLALPLLAAALQRWGWRATFVFAGLFVAFVVLGLSFVFIDKPADIGEYPDGLDPEQAAAAAAADTRQRAFIRTGPDFTAHQALRTRAFWLISLGHGFALLVVGAVMAHLQLFLTTEQDFSLAQASLVAGALPLIQLVGQLLGGVLGDRYSKRLISSLAMVGHVVGLLVLAAADSPVAVWAFVPLHGLAWGVRGPLMQAWRADYFGPTSFGQIMGYSSLVIMVGQVGGPLLAGGLSDATGSYRLGFTIVALLASAGMVFFALAAPPPPPAVAADEPEPAVGATSNADSV